MSKYLAALVLAAVIGPLAHADDENKQDNRGQAVSECNHRANEREMKGQDRQDFVDWCTARQQTWSDDSWNRYRECYDRAIDRGLKDDKRHEFIETCIAD